MKRRYKVLFHCGWQPTQELEYESDKRKGSKANYEDAFRAIRKSFGFGIYKTAVIDYIYRVVS